MGKTVQYEEDIVQKTQKFLSEKGQVHSIQGKFIIWVKSKCISYADILVEEHIKLKEYKLRLRYGKKYLSFLICFLGHNQQCSGDSSSQDKPRAKQMLYPVSCLVSPHPLLKRVILWIDAPSYSNKTTAIQPNKQHGSQVEFPPNWWRKSTSLRD